MSCEFTVPFYVAEDCAGLGTGYLALQRTAKRMQRKRKTGNVKLKLKCKYVSESNPRLRAFLHSKYKHRGLSSKTVIANDCAMGSDDGGDKHLGTDGEVDLYLTGSQCQPFSKMGKNGGRADERSDTMRDAVSFIMKRKPKTFILEQVPNIKSKPHNNFWEKIINQLKSIKTRKTRKLYKLHTQTLNSQDFGVPQIRRRLYVVGIRRDIGKAFSKFKMPTIGMGRKAKLETLLRKANSSLQVKDSELNNTELRNWRTVQGKLSQQTEFPVIADFHMSESFGASFQSQRSPTITKTRARGQAFWLIDKISNGSLTEGRFVKRRLDVSDYAALQGWDTAAQKNYLKIGRNRFLTDSELREALGNGFNIAVFEAILQNLLLCHFNATEAIHARCDEIRLAIEEDSELRLMHPRWKVRRDQKL
jgi:DNA-cytosine methyltransferase